MPPRNYTASVGCGEDPLQLKLRCNVALAHTMREAVAAAYGRRYSVTGAVGLYPTSGTSDDYPYSRNFLGSGTARSWATPSGGRSGNRFHRASTRGTATLPPAVPRRFHPVPRRFHPRYRDMVPIIEEVTAGLLARE